MLFNINKPIHWDNPDLDIEKQYSYKLKVYDKDGKEDTTLEKDLNIVLADKGSFIKENVEDKTAWLKKEASRNSLKKTNH